MRDFSLSPPLCLFACSFSSPPIQRGCFFANCTRFLHMLCWLLPWPVCPSPSRAALRMRLPWLRTSQLHCWRWEGPHMWVSLAPPLYVLLITARSRGIHHLSIPVHPCKLKKDMMISLPPPISQGMPYKFSSSSCFPGPDGESGSAVPQGLGFLHHQPLHTGPPGLYFLSGWGDGHQKHSSWEVRPAGYQLRYVGHVRRFLKLWKYAVSYL